MSLSTSRLAYTACYEAYDRAMASDRGIRLHFPNFSAANYYRMRCHMARKIDRRENKAIHPDPQHPLHGTSQYDALQLTIERVDGEFYLYFRKQVYLPSAIEDLDSLEADRPLVSHVKQLTLPPPPLRISPPKMHDLEDVVEAEVTEISPALRRRDI
jgi:hypothetical protein